MSMSFLSLFFFFFFISTPPAKSNRKTRKKTQITTTNLENALRPGIAHLVRKHVVLVFGRVPTHASAQSRGSSGDHSATRPILGSRASPRPPPSRPPRSPRTPPPQPL